MKNTDNFYNNYHALISEISENSKRMTEICESIGMEQQANALTESRKKLKSHKFAVGVLGEFRHGKSTVINAMLGREIMPSDIIPTTATMNRVSYGLTPYVELEMDDGSKQKIEVDELKSYVTKLDADSAERASHVNEAVVYYPCQFCQNGVDIVDTPGLNDDERMNRITEETIPKLDAVIMVLVPGSPFSMSESEFVRNKLMSSDVSRLIFLVNKIDTVRRESDRIRLLEELKKRIRETVLKRTEEVYGIDSEYYSNVKRKLADLSLFPISALDALDGRLENDSELLENSGMLQFEESLCHMLTEERGLLEVMPQISKLITVGTEAAESIVLMQGSLETDVETFKNTQTEVLNEIKNLKQEKEAETVRVRNKLTSTRQELSHKAEQCYAQMEQEASSLISQITPPAKALKDNEKKDLFDQTIQKIQGMIDDVLSIHAEKLTADLKAAIEETGTDIAANVIAKGKLNLDKQFESISVPGKKKSNAAWDVTAVTLETFTTYLGIIGIGGVIRGAKVAGVKGAVVGGISGAAITAGAIAGLAALTGPIGLPLVILTSVAGTYGGGAIADALFSKDRAKKQIAELKADLQRATNDAITQMRVNRELEKWIQEQVTTQFDSLIEDMNTECNRIIAEAERKISEIEKNICSGEIERQNKRDHLDEMALKVTDLLNELKKICAELDAQNAKKEAVNV